MDSWLKSHATDVPDLVLGLDGEPHFLLTVATGDERNVQPYALRAECTHLGCLAVWRPGLELLTYYRTLTHIEEPCAC
jgi:hypothetical protein